MNNNTTVYIGMDVHKESFTLCCFALGEKEPGHVQTVPSEHILVVKYVNRLRKLYGEETEFICGYEAGCLGYTLYHQLKEDGLECVILAPTTMMEQKGKKRVKTDKRDAKKIAKCLAYHTYSPVHIPTEEDDQVKEYIRMRDDIKANLKRTKQQILSFCLRHGLVYTQTKTTWTQAHLKWLHDQKLDSLYQEILDEYILQLTKLMETVERLDKRIEALSKEVGDFKRFASACQFSSYLGLTPGEDSSGDDQKRLGITKAGNTHVRKLLVEAAQSYGRGKAGYKSKALKERQEGNPPQVIAYADRGNERLRRKFYNMLFRGKKVNVAKTALARELACFIWGMMNEKLA